MPKRTTLHLSNTDLNQQLKRTDTTGKAVNTEQRKFIRYKRNDPDPLFKFHEFQNAYEILKSKGKISRPDILDFSSPVSPEVYEALFINTLKAVHQYCSTGISNERLLKKYSRAYEREYERMEAKLREKYSNYSYLHKAL